MSTLQPGQSSTTPRAIVTTQNPCGSANYMCDSGCIDSTKVCDFHNDCKDGTDEQNCGTCDFERTDPLTGTPSMCGWHDIGYGKKQWTVVSAVVTLTRSSYLPRRDGNNNSTGKFLIIDTSKGQLNSINLKHQDKIFN